MWTKLKELVGWGAPQSAPTQAPNSSVAPAKGMYWVPRPGDPDPTVHGIVPPPPPFAYEVPAVWREPATRPALQWVEAAQNRFGVRYLDCRPFSHTMISTVGSQEQLNVFVAGRNSSGEEHRGADPAEPRRVSCRLVYPPGADFRDGPVVRSTMLEDKWDVFLFSNTFYFVRSWSRTLVHRAPVTFGPEGAVLSEIVTSAPVAAGDETLPCREVDFLVRSILLRELLPHPISRDVPPDPETIAQVSFSRYGRYAYFATYDSVLERSTSL